MREIHISIAPEKIFTIGSLDITNSILGTIVVCTFLCISGVLIGNSINKHGFPNKAQNAIEWFYGIIAGVATSNIGSKDKARPFLGLALTLFLFIVFGSWFGLLPGVLNIGITEIEKGKELFIPIFRAPTTDLNATIALAIIAFLTIQYAGFKALGWNYLGKFFQFKKGAVFFAVGILELVSEFARLITFSFRLFGSIFAGEVLIVVIAFLTKFNFSENGSILSGLNYGGVPLPALVILMEFGVAMIQAYVFISLMTVFISLAVVEPH